MHRISSRWLLPAAFAVVASAPLAQHRPGTDAMPDPLNAQAAIAPLVHQSTLANDRRLADPEPVAWSEANQTVGRIGGWRAYAREAAEPAAPERAAAPASAPAASMPAGRGGHPAH